MVERIDQLIVSEGVDVYRQDFNMDPLSFWRGNDAADRQGITEIKHVQGYLAYWDELLRRHPGMLIDSCASGGRRDDLETMRRAVPFLRSDYCTDPDGTQCHTYGFNLWLPYYRGATDKIDAYDFRSNFSPLMMVVWDMRNKGLDYAQARKLIGQWRQVAPYLFGDFYPLTNYSTTNSVWMAWQFDCPERGEGLVQAFRREKCPGESIRATSGPGPERRLPADQFRRRWHDGDDRPGAVAEWPAHRYQGPAGRGGGRLQEKSLDHGAFFMKTTTLLGVATVWLLSSHFAAAISPTPGEMSETRRWVAAKFEGARDTSEPAFGLYVLANHDAVQPNSRSSQPLQIGDRQYTRGLYCHAVSKIVVRLPAAGKTFTARAGVDSNEQTRPGRGSVVFSVTIGGTSVFRSALMREGMPAIPVQADLGGAKEFLLDVGDGGDGISCDQADWADARVVLADGRAVWLGDLPIFGGSYRRITMEPFFSLLYGGKPFSELCRTWKLERDSRKLDDRRTEHTLTYTDPATGLVVRCVGAEFADFPAVEWVVNFENTGKADTPILEGIEALDAVLPLPGEGSATLHWSKGGVASFEDFAPQQAAFDVGAKQHLEAGEGRSSSNLLPFFNVEGRGSGTVVALGWSGDWTADFAGNLEGVSLKAGMTKTHLLLHPGETIRSPRMLLLCYRGDRWRGQNLLRQFILAHHRPQLKGRPLVAPITWGNWGGTTAEVHLDNIQKIVDHRLPIEYYWIDAGWYGRGGVAGDWGRKPAVGTSARTSIPTASSR